MINYSRRVDNDGDAITLVYSWLRKLTPSPAAAADLTVDVFRRVPNDRPAWLGRVEPRTRMKILTIQAVRHSARQALLPG